jgi:hypothetical protein
VDWVVGRPLGLKGSDFAVKAATIDEVLGGPSPASGFPEFTRTITQFAAEIAEKIYPEEGWRYLLPWLTRDQEARFTSLTAWRDASSEGDNPRTKASSRHQLMRAVLHLLDLREPALRSDIEVAQSKLESGQFELGRLQVEAENLAVLLRASALNVVGDSAPEDSDALSNRLSSMLDVLKQGMNLLEKEPDPPALVAASQLYNQARDQIAENKYQTADLAHQIENLKVREREKMTVVRNFRTGNVEDPTREGKGWCPKTIEYAREHCLDKESISGESALNIDTLEQEGKDLTKQIQQAEAQRAAKLKVLPLLQQAEAKAAQSLQEAKRIANREITSLGKRLEQAEGLERLRIRSLAATQSLVGKKTALAKLEQEIESKKKQIAALRSNLDEKRILFSNDFADIIRAVMGGSVEPSITIDQNGIVAHASRKSELSGAALDSIKTIAFDLAAVVSSVEGRGEHPRFLIHDGPREGDMARIIYERFFFYAEELEKAFDSPDQASFQYIITTTTHPPATMREGSRWLLLPVLDSRTKEGRLLREDF